MVLVKIADLYPDYKKYIFEGNDIKNFTVYSYTDEKIGSVQDILVDETGSFRYLVIDTGFWIFGKKVLLPIGRASVDYSQERIYAKSLTKEQAENLPEYDDNMTIDRDYEERVRMVYRGVEYAPNNTVYAEEAQSYDSGAYTGERNSSEYDREPNLYAHQETDNRHSLKLYEERLVANKERFRAGAVTIGKRVETETANVSVPVEKERVVIERNNPTNAPAVAPGEATFNDGEVARVEVYEESANIEKKAFVREEVSVRKEVEQDTVSAQETVRREELEVETEGEALVNRDL
ncbi:MAG: DUF2382 domain-containing protein [Xenococcaceae cyanobacterium MO_188.B32]|nr:DUF2382 domain-containing protein [Xenococcaceae cyanobacterium MO_188.B32]